MKKRKNNNNTVLLVVESLGWILLFTAIIFLGFFHRCSPEDKAPEETRIECASGVGRIVTTSTAEPFVVDTEPPETSSCAETTTEPETTVESETEPILEPETEIPTPVETEPIVWETEAYVPEPEIPATDPPQTTDGYLGTFLITGYTAEAGFPVGQATHSGAPVGPGVCAMNYWQRIGLGIEWGTEIYIEGIGTFTVLDSGCEWGVVDVWVPTNEEAFNMTAYHNVYLLR